MVLPLFLLGDTPPGKVFAESESITDGNKRTCLRLGLVWLVLAFLLTLVPALFLNIATGWLIGGDSLKLSTLLLSTAMFFGKPEVAKQYRDNSP